jgi:hypothetical protein
MNDTARELLGDAGLRFDARAVKDFRDPLGVLQSHGAVLLQNAIDPAVAVLPLSGIDAWYDGRIRRLEPGELISGGHLNEPVAPILTAVGASLFTPIARAFLRGTDIGVPVNHMLYRRRNDANDAHWEESGSKHYFHQDQGLVPDDFPMNAWIAASEVNDEALGISIVFPTPTEPMQAKFDAFDVDAYLRRTNGWEWSPVMHPGDMLIFHNLTIHGSRVTRGRSGTRYSIEFRAGDAEKAPTEYSNVMWRL